MDAELVKGTLSLAILSLVSREPMYGYRLVATAKEKTDGAFQWKEGSLYPALHRLEKDGLIEGKWERTEGKRQRKYYHITQNGREVLAEKKAAWEALVAAVNSILEKDHGRD